MLINLKIKHEMLLIISQLLGGQHKVKLLKTISSTYSKVLLNTVHINTLYFIWSVSRFWFVTDRVMWQSFYCILLPEKYCCCYHCCHCHHHVFFDFLVLQSGVFIHMLRILWSSSSSLSSSFCFAYDWGMVWHLEFHLVKTNTCD
jgi:hypothetical protein